MRYSADSEMRLLLASPEAMEVLDRYFGGEPDPLTLELLGMA